MATKRRKYWIIIQLIIASVLFVLLTSYLLVVLDGIENPDPRNLLNINQLLPQIQKVVIGLMILVGVWFMLVLRSWLKMKD